MGDISTALIITLLVVLAAVGAAFLLVGTTDGLVIRDCREQGWHNFGQTRIICSVEPKKEGR